MANRDLKKSNGLYNELYIFEANKVMLASNLWHGVGLHNCDKGEVVNFFTTIKKVQEVKIFPKFFLTVSLIKGQFLGNFFQEYLKLL